MATKPSAEEVTDEKPKSKKKLVIAAIVAVVVLLVAGAGLYVMNRHNSLDEEDEEVAAQPAVPSGPPVYLPLENMVVNLADPGGERVVQVGVTLELTSPKAPERVKPYLPAIRSSVLMLVSQRKSEELLQREGKEQLAADIFAEVSRNFVTVDPADEDGAKKKKKKKKGEKPEEENPVRRVLFSSFIVQ